MVAEVTQMKITSQKGVGFYLRSAASFLNGTDDKPAVPILEISALGNAINSAVAVAGRLEKDGTAVIQKMETGYADVENSGKTRGCSQLKVTIKKK